MAALEDTKNISKHASKTFEVIWIMYDALSYFLINI